MRIQHNISAMNSYRNYTGNTNKLSKNLEKLSSGYKINRAGDDAAGLAISEKMRAQISGLSQAQNNVKDGISLIKTAEGALQEVQDMLNRMVTLATQSANGTYQNDVDRDALQDEVDALATEINRIGSTANFNGQKLLDSSMASVTFQIGDSSDSTNTLNMEDALGGQSKFDLTSFVVGSTGTAAGTAKKIDVSSSGAALTTLRALRGDGDAKNGLINQVSSYRGKLGAVQNRLEHTQNNLSVMKENVQDAESTIRDTDIADEMTNYTKNNILLQSAQAMLAQANQMPQGVLQLLQ